MNAEKLAIKTQKQQEKLFQKAFKKGVKRVQKDINHAMCRGEFVTCAFIYSWRDHIPSEMTLRLRDAVAEVYQNKGYYIRKYTFGHDARIFDTEYLRISWGKAIENQIYIDGVQERLMKERLAEGGKTTNGK